LLSACSSAASSPVGNEATPTIGWSRTFGSQGDDGASTLAVDGSGNVIVGGWTTGALTDEPNRGGHDAFVRKFNSLGEEQWTVQLGTEGEDATEGVVTGSDGRVYIAGRVEGILPGQADSGGGDAFAAVYATDGGEIWLRQFGTDRLDWGEDVAVDAEGNVFVSGSTSGAFPGEKNASLADNYVRRFNPDGSPSWTQQIGSDEGNGATSVVVDKRGNVYLVGSTLGPLPSTEHIGSGDVFVSKYDNVGTELWSREYGSIGGDAAIGTALDEAGNLYVVGATRGIWDGQVRIGGFLDAFLLVVDQAGQLLTTTQFGTAGSDMASGVAVDSQGNVYVTGRTDGAFRGQTNRGGFDAFAAKFDKDGEALWTVQFGSPTDDFAFSVAVDNNGNVYVAGLGHLTTVAATTPPDAWVVQFTQ
jgi:hypothetical protein